jgi:hypothetical protein
MINWQLNMCLLFKHKLAYYVLYLFNILRIKLLIVDVEYNIKFLTGDYIFEHIEHIY